MLAKSASTETANIGWRGFIGFSVASNAGHGLAAVAVKTSDCTNEPMLGIAAKGVVRPMREREEQGGARPLDCKRCLSNRSNVSLHNFKNGEFLGGFERSQCE